MEASNPALFAVADNQTKPEENNPQVIFSWKAPLRAYKKRGKNVLRFFLAVALLSSLIVFFFGDRILLVPIWSVLFLFYTLTITPPPEVNNKVTKFGIETAGIMMRWDVLSHFFYIRRFNYEIVVVVTHAPYYIHSYLVIPDGNVKKNVTHFLSEHLVYQEEPQRSFTDKAVEWLSRLIPDDEEEPVKKSESQSVTPPSPASSQASEQTQPPPSLLNQLSAPNG